MLKKFTLAAMLTALVFAQSTMFADDDNTEKKSEIRIEKRVIGKVIRIDEDGKMEILDRLPNDIQERIKTGGLSKLRGSITIIGSDGKKHIQTFGDGKDDGDSVSKAIEKALKASGKGLPAGVQGKLKEALKDLPGVRLEIERKEIQTSDTVVQKLDEILKRLGKLEKDVEQLKK